MIGSAGISHPDIHAEINLARTMTPCQPITGAGWQLRPYWWKFREEVPNLFLVAESLARGLSAEAALVGQERRSFASVPVPGTRQLQRRLDAASVDALVDGYLSGETVYKLATEFGIERRTESAHLHRR